MRESETVIRRIGTISLIVLSLAVSWQSANADIAEHCSGKYAHAAELVDAAHSKYGTLYSGGYHRHRTDHVGATLDLYRFWRGLPDAKLRDANVTGIRQDYDSAEEYWNWPAVSEVWARAKWASTDVVLETLGERDRAFAAHGFDRLTGIQHPLDGWRSGERPERSLEGWPKAVALMAENPALDWMQSVAVASHADYALYWHLEPNMSEGARAAHARIAATDWNRFQGGDGMEWAVSAALHFAKGQELPGLGETFQFWSDRVATCEASPAEYAALASAQVALGRLSEFELRTRQNKRWVYLDEFMSGGIKALLDRHRFRRELINLPTRCTRDGEAALADDVAVEAVMHRLYAACKIEHVPLSDTAYAFRAYNLLSTDHLAKLGRQEGAPGGLVRAAFARHVALGNWQKAEDLLPDLIAATPVHADRIEKEWSTHSRPRPVRLARIILFTPNLSTMIASTARSEPGMHLHVSNALGGVDDSGSVTGTRNLLQEYLNEYIMQRDYEVLLRLPHRWSAYWGVRNGLPNILARKFYRQASFGVFRLNNDARPTNGLPEIGRPIDCCGVPFVRNLTDASELSRLSGEQALMKTVADIILDWSEDQTSGWWARRFGNHEADAEALAQLITLCRYNACGAHAGQPQARRAFELLEQDMARTDAAKAVKYWWAFDPPYRR